MPSTMKILWTCCVLMAVVIIISGCGDSDKTAAFDPETSVHPTDWLPAKHKAEARDSLDSCRQCHGADLISGGISGLGCDTCHLGGPFFVHPAEWGESAVEEHGNYIVLNGTHSCRNIQCHGPGLEGVPQGGPSCNDCHPFAG